MRPILLAGRYSDEDPKRFLFVLPSPLKNYHDGSRAKCALDDCVELGDLK